LRAKPLAPSGASGNHSVARGDEERSAMAIHLTPTELARETGMHRREVIARCMQLGVPIFQGRIDKTLFLSTLEASKRQQDELAKV
jgi:hypothetical protein